MKYIVKKKIYLITLVCSGLAWLALNLFFLDTKLLKINISDLALYDNKLKIYQNNKFEEVINLYKDNNKSENSFQNFYYDSVINESLNPDSKLNRNYKNNYFKIFNEKLEKKIYEAKTTETQIFSAKSYSYKKDNSGSYYQLIIETKDEEFAIKYLEEQINLVQKEIQKNLVGELFSNHMERELRKIFLRIEKETAEIDIIRKCRSIVNDSNYAEEYNDHKQSLRSKNQSQRLEIENKSTDISQEKEYLLIFDKILQILIQQQGLLFKDVSFCSKIATINEKLLLIELNKKTEDELEAIALKRSNEAFFSSRILLNENSPIKRKIMIEPKIKPLKTLGLFLIFGIVISYLFVNIKKIKNSFF